MKTARALFAVVVGALVLCGAATSASEVKIAPVTRLPFPERGYVVNISTAARLDTSNVEVRENGLRVNRLRVDPLASSGLRFGVVLALDSSESMTGAPAAAALKAARAFVSHRARAQEVGIVAFNTDISVLRAPTQDDAALRNALSVPPRIAYGTHINDALMRSLTLLRKARVSTGSIVLLSDGQEVGSSLPLEQVVAAAKKQEVRVFTVGLRSRAFDASALKEIADQTGGSYAEARSAAELAPIYEALGEKLAGEYLIRYRSASRPMSEVNVSVKVAGTGRAIAEYVAPTPSLLPPYHRSFASRFLLSGTAPVLISIFVALLVCLLLVLATRRPKSTLVDRVQSFAGRTGTRSQYQAPAAALRAATRNQYASGWWARLERDLELARMTVTPKQVVGLSLGGTMFFVLAALVLSLPLLALLGLTTPLVARTVVRRKLKALRNEFAEQFPASLQVLASALRAGHSFNGALGVVVDNASEPARSELVRVVQDDKLGVLPEDAIRRLARRMANRDIEQVALLAELQRTSGGNSAEILDTVVATIRERADIRRLARTLTAQGRMARWILTGLPVFVTGVLWFSHPDVMKAFFTSGIGQVLFVVAALMVVAGSLVIQRIIEIEV